VVVGLSPLPLCVNN